MVGFLSDSVSRGSSFKSMAVDIRLIIFTLLGVLAGIMGFYPYFKDIFLGTTKPHVFTWISWSLINIIIFTAQAASGAGLGSVVAGFLALMCVLISLLAVFRGEKRITLADYICFAASLGGIMLWAWTRNPLLAVIVITIADTLAFVPTIRKSWKNPYQETAISYAIATLRSTFAVLSLDSFLLTNWLHPASLIVADGGFTVMLLIRRRQLNAVVS